MYPFQVPNSYLNLQFPYNLNYDYLGQYQLEGNLLHYPDNYQILNSFHQNPITSYLIPRQLPSFCGLNENNSSGNQPLKKRKKRITKKLSLTKMKLSFLSLNMYLKPRRKSFKYFDPSRAPPITSLRNSRELEFDLRKETLKTEEMNLQKDNVSIMKIRNIAKLEIMLKEPNSKEYPFLICKKRKYHRNSKRRYSVAYFQRRASYIMKKQLIPASLHPKNKVRKSRELKNQISQRFLSQQQSQNSQFYASSSSKSNHESVSDEFQIENEGKYEKLSK